MGCWLTKLEASPQNSQLCLRGRGSREIFPNFEDIAIGDVFGVKKKVGGDLKATRQEDLVMELKTRLPELQSPTETWDENGATKPSVIIVIA